MLSAAVEKRGKTTALSLFRLENDDNEYGDNNWPFLYGTHQTRGVYLTKQISWNVFPGRFTRREKNPLVCCKKVLRNPHYAFSCQMLWPKGKKKDDLIVKETVVFMNQVKLSMCIKVIFNYKLLTKVGDPAFLCSTVHSVSKMGMLGNSIFLQLS